MKVDVIYNEQLRSSTCGSHSGVPQFGKSISLSKRIWMEGPRLANPFLMENDLISNLNEKWVSNHVWQMPVNHEFFFRLPLLFGHFFHCLTETRIQPSS